MRLRWKLWELFGRRYWYIQVVEPKESWDLVANQFLLQIADEYHMYIEFISGNYESNLNFKSFIILIQVGMNNRRDFAVVSAWIVGADI